MKTCINVVGQPLQIGDMNGEMSREFCLQTLINSLRLIFLIRLLQIGYFDVPNRNCDGKIHVWCYKTQLKPLLPSNLVLRGKEPTKLSIIEWSAVAKFNGFIHKPHMFLGENSTMKRWRFRERWIRDLPSTKHSLLTIYSMRNLATQKSLYIHFLGLR